MGRPTLPDAPCAVDGCESLRAKGRRGYCGRHYTLWYRNGDPEVQRRATSTEGVDRAFKEAWVQAYKLERGCADCGYDKHPAALDFDHLPGSVKVRDIKSGQHLGWVALQEEVKKCEVVCANCHRIRTANRRQALRGGEAE